MQYLHSMPPFKCPRSEGWQVIHLFTSQRTVATRIQVSQQEKIDTHYIPLHCTAVTKKSIIEVDNRDRNVHEITTNLSKFRMVVSVQNPRGPPFNLSCPWEVKNFGMIEQRPLIFLSFFLDLYQENVLFYWIKDCLLEQYRHKEVAYSTAPRLAIYI